MLFHIIDFFKVRDVCPESFSVDLIDSDLSWICVVDHGIWLIYNKISDCIEYVAVSRLDCLETLSYFYGLPF